GSAPATIPLWYFDETKGMWIEEGSATLQGNTYTGTVTHFSFWNWDIPFSAIIMELTLVDQNNNPLQNYTIKLTNTANSDWRSGTTNADGWVGGLTYSNATLTLEVYNGVCTNIPIHTQTITTR